MDELPKRRARQGRTRPDILLPIDEAYLEKLADYFARTSDDMGERAPYEGGRGLAASCSQDGSKRR